MVAVPPIPGINRTPAGNTPLSLIVAIGVTIDVTTNVPGRPATKLVVVALVIVGEAPETVGTTNVKICVAGLPTPFVAVSSKATLPDSADADVAVHAIVAVP